MDVKNVNKFRTEWQIFLSSKDQKIIQYIAYLKLINIFFIEQRNNSWTNHFFEWNNKN